LEKAKLFNTEYNILIRRWACANSFCKNQQPNWELFRFSFKYHNIETSNTFLNLDIHLGMQMHYSIWKQQLGFQYGSKIRLQNVLSPND